MGFSLWELIIHYIKGTELVEKPKEPISVDSSTSLFWGLVVMVVFPTYLYYLSFDVDHYRFLKAMGAIICLIFIYYTIVFILWMYSSTNIVGLRYTLGGLIWFLSILYLGILLYLARRGRHYNEVVEQGGYRRKRY
jgi:hypothetical protein